jgi:hypothetical protein
MGLALAQPDESNIFEDVYAESESWLAPTGSGGAAATGSILDLISGAGSGIVSAITQPDVVKATLNKYVFGSTGAIPTGTTYRPPTGVSVPLIAGIPNMYLAVGAGLALLLLVTGRKGRR